MMGVDVNPYPILLLVNYWEIRPSLMGARLDELLKRGVTQFAAFVPWQAAESDISHMLMRFLQAVSDRRMKVSLILSPEVGIHYPNSGLPKDLILKKENRSQDFQGGSITVSLPPNAFHLPSLFAPEFNKRYYGFLARMDSFFADLFKTQPSLMKGVQVALSGSFWKYYRSTLASNQSIFGGNGGDYSSHAAVAYRQGLDHFYSQREFMDPTPSSANKWKTRTLEDMNRKWFYQHSEDVFRTRSQQMVRKKMMTLPVMEMEIHAPEADPAAAYSNFIQMLSGGHADFTRLSSILDECQSRSTASNGGSTVPYIHWCSLGGFRMLAEAEKQFLILKSILLNGTQGGGVLIDDVEWFTLSANFRSRAESLSRSLAEGELILRSRALYLAPHLWSHYGDLWEELYRRLGPEAKMVSSTQLISREKYSNLLIVDPSYILTKEVIQKLSAWAKAGRVVVIPRSQLFSEAAKGEFDKLLQKSQNIEMALGVSYSLYSLGDGKLIAYDIPKKKESEVETQNVWQSFLSSVLSVAEIENYCRLSDSRLSLIPFEIKKDEVGLVILNGTRRQVTADLIFPNPVRISDLGMILSKNSGVPIKEVVVPESEKPEPNHRFSLDVPPFGVLPLQVEGLNLAEFREKQVAALTSEETRANAMIAASTELPGFSSDQSFEELWN